MRTDLVRDADALAGLTREWEALWTRCEEAPATLHPTWIETWWAELGGGELRVVVCRDEGELVGVAPFYLTVPRGGRWRRRELRLAADGLLPGRSAILARGSHRAAVARAVADAFIEAGGWDLLDVVLAEEGDLPLLAEAFAADERKTELGPVPGPLLQRTLATSRSPELPAGVRRYDGDRLAVALGAVAALAATGPRSEAAFQRFLAQVATKLHQRGLARIYAAESGGVMTAGALILVDGPRWVVLLAGSTTPGSLERVFAAVAAEASLERERRLVLPVGERPGGGVGNAFRLCVYQGTAAGLLQRGYSTLARRAGAMAGAAVQGMRSPVDRVGERLGRLAEQTPESVQRVVARVATFSRLHLYRGELYVRGAASTEGLALRIFSEADFDRLADRAAFLHRLALVEDQARETWWRGDLAILAERDGLPVGILWYARAPVFVPIIGRAVRPLPGESYIHDVFVPPDARGRAVAPAMLDCLARELRQRDTYGAWALIERSNTPSTRAFGKAGYVPVADVIYARMGRASKLLVRPPDADARAFLGLTPPPLRP